jgi:hypothetical protein
MFAEGFVPLPTSAQHRNSIANGWACAPKQCNGVLKIGAGC